LSTYSKTEVLWEWSHKRFDVVTIVCIYCCYSYYCLKFYVLKWFVKMTRATSCN